MGFCYKYSVIYFAVGFLVYVTNERVIRTIEKTTQTQLIVLSIRFLDVFVNLGPVMRRIFSDLSLVHNPTARQNLWTVSSRSVGSPVMMPDPCIVTDPSQVQLERSRKQDQFFPPRYLLDQRSVILTMGIS